MPPIPLKHADLMRFLDDEYQKLHDRYYRSAPQGGTIPAGGGDWMDCHFRMEAIRGCVGALRRKKPLEEAIAEGEAVSEIAVKLWNTRREYQVRRWEKTGGEFLKGKIRHFYVLKAAGKRF